MYYTAEVSWTQQAIDAARARGRQYFTGYEYVPGRFASEAAARAALMTQIERPEIVAGSIFCYEERRGGQDVVAWRKTINKHASDQQLTDLIANSDGTDVWGDER